MIAFVAIVAVLVILAMITIVVMITIVAIVAIVASVNAILPPTHPGRGGRDLRPCVCAPAAKLRHHPHPRGLDRGESLCWSRQRLQNYVSIFHDADSFRNIIFSI